jgi:hypothetical protein
MRGSKARALRQLVYGPDRSHRLRDYTGINQRIYSTDQIHFGSTFTALDKGCRGAYLEMKKQERGNRT